MFSNELKPGQTFYCVPVLTSGKIPHVMEIYEFKGINPITKQVLYDIVLGERFTCVFPDGCDLDKGFYEYYDRNCIWFFTTNDNIAVDVYKRFLNKDYIEIHLVYDVWLNKWKTVNIYLRENNDNEGEFCSYNS